MTGSMRRCWIGLTVVVLCACTTTPHSPGTSQAARPARAMSGTATLAAWNDTPAERSIVDFVTRVTTPESKDFVPRAERIAVFDLDGTLWPEQPAPVQLVFTLQRVKTLAPRHPEWKRQEPYRSILRGNLKNVANSGDAGSMKLLAATHAGMTPDSFSSIVHDWFDNASDPRFNRPYSGLAYQPMVEVLAFLRANGFKTYIVSADSVEFIRAISQSMYGVPPDEVIGSTVRYQYGMSNGAATMTRLAQVETLNDGATKPQTIQAVVGRRPLMAFGNSDADLPMLEWTTSGDGPRFAALVHHTDAQREYAYDRAARTGKLDKGLEEANVKGWLIVDMKDDWQTVFKGEAAGTAAAK
ncbi:MAG: HAD family hydrolase [Paraburkholderia sp.]|uniref:HAD family hydrolase n=1 Tax=Burkholderiaceae TaxID=119060 RepID=UPI0010F96DBE|nr:HAD family hydrolase [Burkholderia sp. 4M9327F10]